MVLGLIWGWFLHFNHPRVAVVRAVGRAGARRPFWTAWRAFRTYGFLLVERRAIFAGRARAELDVDPAGQAALDVAIASREPTVLLGSHIGALELAGLLLGDTGRRIVAVTARDVGAAALLREVGDPAVGLGGMPTIVADGSARSGLAMLRAAREGALLGIKADRPLPGSAPGETVLVPLLGEPAPLPLGPARLVRALGARAVAVSVVRTGPLRYRVLSADLPATGSAEELVAAYADVMSAHVRAFPSQWFNFHPLWPSDRAALAGVPRTVPPALRAVGRGAARAALWALTGLGAVVVVAAASGHAPVGAVVGCLAGLVGLLGGLAALPGLQVFGPVACRGGAVADGVALTFDDGPDPEGTPAVLDALDAVGARATFFLLGERVLRHPALARDIVARGHEIALHGHDHRVARAFWRPSLHADLARAEAAIEAVCGVRPCLVRPPAGVFVPSLLDVFRARGLRPVAWSVRPRDGLGGSAQGIARRVLSVVGPGDVVLLHDARPPIGLGGVPAALALPVILRGLQDRGLRALPLSEVLGVPAERPGPPRPVERAARRTAQELAVGPVLIALTLLWLALAGR